MGRYSYHLSILYPTLNFWTLSLPNRLGPYNFNPFILEFLKWTLPSLNSNMSTNENRDFSLKSKAEWQTV